MKAKGTSVNDDSGHNLNVYPNPSEDKFTFDLPEIAANINLKIFDTIGSEIYNKSFQNLGSLEVDLSNLNYSGILTAVINADSYIATEKLILMN